MQVVWNEKLKNTFICCLLGYRLALGFRKIEKFRNIVDI